MTDAVEKVARALHDEMSRRDIDGYLRMNIDCFDLARAAIAAMPGWQPIETAPKDGSHLMLGMAADQYVGEGYYDEGADAWFPPLQSDTDIPDMRIYPTHWKPLDAPPEVER